MNPNTKTKILTALLMAVSAIMAGSYVWLYQGNESLEAQLHEKRNTLYAMQEQITALEAENELLKTTPLPR